VVEMHEMGDSDAILKSRSHFAAEAQQLISAG
jgi:hypothetical protein